MYNRYIGGVMNLNQYIKGFICITLTIFIILFFLKINANAKENIDISELNDNNYIEECRKILILKNEGIIT